MKTKQLLINEIIEIRKKMGLPLIGDFQDYLNSINKKQIVEQGETKIVKEILEAIFPRLKYLKPTEIDEVLERNPVKLTLPKGDLLEIKSLQDLLDYSKFQKNAGNKGSTSEIITNIFNKKTNQEVTKLRNNIADNLNWMDLRNTVNTHNTTIKNGYTAKVQVGDINVTNPNGVTTVERKPMIKGIQETDETLYKAKNNDQFDYKSNSKGQVWRSPKGLNEWTQVTNKDDIKYFKENYASVDVGEKIKLVYEIDMSSIDNLFDDIEKKFLGKDNASNVRETTNDLFDDNWVDSNVNNKTSEELKTTAAELTTAKDTFVKLIDDITKKIEEAYTNGKITQTQKRNLLNTLTGEGLESVKGKGQALFDNVIEYYNNASATKGSVEEVVELTQKSERTIFDLELKDVEIKGKDTDIFDYKITGDGKIFRAPKGTTGWVELTESEVNLFKTNYSEQLAKIPELERNALINSLLEAANIESIGERNAFVRWFRGGFFASKSSWNIFARPFEEMVSFCTNNWRFMVRTEGNLLKKVVSPLSDIVSESAGRYTYSDITIRLESLLNEMQTVIKNNLTKVDGADAIKNKSVVDARLKDLMKEMQAVMSNRKFAGNVDEIGTDPSKIRDITGVDLSLGEAQLKQLEEIATSFKTKIDEAVNENVVGAKELQDFWNTAYNKSQSNLDVFTQWCQDSDKVFREQKKPNPIRDFLQYIPKEQQDDTKFFIDPSKYYKVNRNVLDDISILSEYFTKKAANNAEKEAIENGTALSEKQIPFQGIDSYDKLKAVPKNILTFVTSSYKMVMSKVVLDGLWNFFRYQHFSSIEQINKLGLRYGQTRGRVILFIRETITGLLIGACLGVTYTILKFIDYVIGLLVPDKYGDYPGHNLLAYGVEKLAPDQLQEEAYIMASQIREFAAKENYMGLTAFLSNPADFKKFIPSGFVEDMYNGVKYFTTGSGDTNADYFTIQPDRGWYESEVDEAIAWSFKLIKGYFTNENDTLDEQESKQRQLFDDLQKRKNEWEKNGIYYGIEKIDEIRSNEKSVKSDVQKWAEKNDNNMSPSIKNDPETYKRLLNIITNEREPDFFNDKRVTSLETPEEQNQKGTELYLDWYKTNGKNVGITDLNGKFWRISTGLGFSNVGSFYNLQEEGKLKSPETSGKFGPYINKNYILNPNDGIWYDLYYLDQFFDKSKIDEIWESNKKAFVEKYTKEQFDEQTKIYIKKKEFVDQQIKVLSEWLNESENCENYPETCKRVKARLYGGEANSVKYVGYVNDLKTIESEYEKAKDAYNKSLNINENYIIKKIMKEIKNYLFESERFDEDDYKHWKDTFEFETEDEKNPGRYKKVKINMEDVMDRINHYRKKYDEDDAFVRAVIDTHENIVRFKFTKDLANINESYSPVGFGKILQQIREDRGELEIWSVSRPASGNWFLVKGDFTQKELAGMDLEKKEPRDKNPKKRENPLHDLKKKEHTSSENLKNDEKQGFDELPKIVKRKLKEKFNNGWSTEEPVDSLKSFYSESLVNSVFGDDIKIYKPRINNEFFNKLNDIKSNINLKKGFCRSLKLFRNHDELSMGNQKFLKRILNNCNNKFEGKLGITRVGS